MVRYAVTEEMLPFSGIGRRFLGNLTLGWEELSARTRWHMIIQNLDLSMYINKMQSLAKGTLCDLLHVHLPGNFPVMSTESSKSQTFP